MMTVETYIQPTLNVKSVHFLHTCSRKHQVSDVNVDDAKCERQVLGKEKQEARRFDADDDRIEAKRLRAQLKRES